MQMCRLQPPGQRQPNIYPLCIASSKTMKTSPDHLPYKAFILRLWQECPASETYPPVWRFSLEETRTRQRRGFADLKEVLDFLQTQIGESEREM